MDPDPLVMDSGYDVSAVEPAPPAPDPEPGFAPLSENPSSTVPDTPPSVDVVAVPPDRPGAPPLSAVVAHAVALPPDTWTEVAPPPPPPPARTNRHVVAGVVVRLSGQKLSPDVYGLQVVTEAPDPSTHSAEDPPPPPPCPESWLQLTVLGVDPLPVELVVQIGVPLLPPGVNPAPPSGPAPLQPNT